MPDDQNPSNPLLIDTNQEDYAPGQTATITATGVNVGATLRIEVDHVLGAGADGILGTADDETYETGGAGHDAWYVTDGGAGDIDGIANGIIVTDWFVDPDDSLNETFVVTAQEIDFGADQQAGTADDTLIGPVAANSFTDSAGAYSLKWYAADPAVNSAPFLPTYDKLTPAEYLATYGGYPVGSATDPFPGAEAYQAPATSANRDAVTSLAPEDMALGQIVPFFLEIVVSGSTAPENGIITFSPEWLAKTTSGGNFGFDPAFGILAAFVDRGDPGTVDPGNNATVSAFSSNTLGIGTNNERIHGDITVSGLNNGDKIIVEIWVVLKNTIPAGVSGNVQTSLESAQTAGGDTINTGNQTVPLLRVQEFFSSAADLSIIKSDDAAAVTSGDDPDPTLYPGDTFTYTIVAKNNSATVISNGVVVTDTLDSDLTFVSATGGGTASGNTVTWNVGSLTQGETATLTVTVMVKNTVTIDALQKELSNTVNITSINTDPNLANNSNTELTNVLPFNPALTIDKEVLSVDGVAGGMVDHAGDVITYKVTVDNAGNQNLTGMSVINSFEGAAATNLLSAGGVVRAGDLNSNNILETSETWTFTYSHTVTIAELAAAIAAGADFDFDNTATADSAQTPSSSDSETVLIDRGGGGNPFYALDIQKSATVGDGTANFAGEIVNYSITVANTGQLALTGVTVTDNFVSNLTRIADLAGDNDNILEFGETWSYTATHAVTQAEIDTNGGGDGFLENTATADSVETDPDTASASVPVARTPSLAIDKVFLNVNGNVGEAANSAGDVLNYTVTVTNTGNTTLTNVTVVDPLTGQSISGVTLAAGASQAYATSYVLTQADIDGQGGGDGDIDNTATADSDQTGPSSDSAEVPLVYAPSLAIDKVFLNVNGNVGEAANSAGDVLNYTVTVTNTGNTTLTNVTVVDPLTGQSISGVTLAAGASQAYATSYVLTQADIDGQGGGDGDIDNTATADSDQTGPSSDSAEVPLVYAPSLAIDKVFLNVNGNVGEAANSAGDVLNYTVTVTNTGNTTLTNVTVVDPLTGQSISGVTLAAGASQAYATSYVLTQADIDGQGGGDGDIDNTATADSDQTGPSSDSAEVPLVYAPSLAIDKVFLNVNGNVGEAANSAGDVLNYTVTVTNTGNTTLTNVTVVDPLTGQSISGVTLAAGASQAYATSYVLTQADIDGQGGGDGDIDNTATADSDQTGPSSDSAEVPLVYAPSLNILKDVTSVTGGTLAGKVNSAGDVINYSITVANTGNTTLTGLAVTDPYANAGSIVRGLDVVGNNNNVFEVGETWGYTAKHTVTQTEIDSNGGGNGILENVAYADSNETPIDSDDANVGLVYNPKIDIEKLVSLCGKFGTYYDADTAAAGPTATMASDAWFKFIVANTGNTTLTNVKVTDNKFLLDGTAGDAVLGDAAYTIASLAVGASQTFYFDQLGLTSGQHTNVATVTTGQGAADSDAANYNGLLAGPGVRTPGFWNSPNGKQFWDGLVGNEAKAGQPGFAAGELLAYNDSNGAAPGGLNANPFIILGGNHDGTLDAGEIKISLADALKFINASAKQQQDARWVLARDAVATELNIRAGNPGADSDPSTVNPQHLLDDAVKWLDLTTNNDHILTTAELVTGQVRTSDTAKWQNPYLSVDHAASILHTQLDGYNNTGFVFGVQFANDEP